MMRTLTIPPLLGRRFQVDFAQARPPVAPLAWILLAIGAIAVSGALLDFAPRWIEHERLARERSDLQARLDRVPGVARSSARAPDAIGLAQARGVLDELDRPWPALLDQFESIDAPDVHLVQLGVDSRFQTVQLLAEASRLEQVLQYSKQLAGKGPVRSVRLTHHEWRAAPGGRIVLADLSATLGPDSQAGKGSR
jgi:hypothetical protein